MDLFLNFVAEESAVTPDVKDSVAEIVHPKAGLSQEQDGDSMHLNRHRRRGLVRTDGDGCSMVLLYYRFGPPLPDGVPCPVTREPMRRD